MAFRVPIPYLLKAAGFEVRLSPHQRKHTSAETAELLGDVDVLVAGTEPLSAEVLAKGLPHAQACGSGGCWPGWPGCCLLPSK